MEENNDFYDIIVEKTVKDLFRFSNLSHIKNIKQAKEAEIDKLEIQLKDLMLEKYSLLVNSIDNVKSIYSDLSELKVLKYDISTDIATNSKAVSLIDEIKTTKDRLDSWSKDISSELTLENKTESSTVKEIWKKVDQLRNCFNIKILNDIIRGLSSLNNVGKSKDFNFDIILSEVLDLLIDHALKVSYSKVSTCNEDDIMSALNCLFNLRDNLNIVFDSVKLDIITYDKTTEKLYDSLYTQRNKSELSKGLLLTLNPISLYIKIKLIKLQGYLVKFNIENIFYDFIIMIITINSFLAVKEKLI